jgi:zinc transport system substrate-binding protein
MITGIVIVQLLRTILVIGAAVLLCAGCGGGSSGSGGVVAAFYPLAWAAEGVGVHATNLTPPGAEPHDIELTPGEVAEIQRAGVVLYLSHGFQPAVEKALEDADGTKVDALAGVRLHAGSGDEAGAVDPHVWLDPVLFARVVTQIGSALDRGQRGEALARRVLALDGQYRRGLTDCRRREFVTSHAAFGYLAERYHLKQIAITGVDPESEPSAQALRRLAALVRRDHIRTVFFERLVSPRLAQTLARETGARTALLDPIEGAPHGETYLTLMRENLAALRKALECR